VLILSPPAAPIIKFIVFHLCFYWGMGWVEQKGIKVDPIITSHALFPVATGASELVTAFCNDLSAFPPGAPVGGL